MSSFKKYHRQLLKTALLTSPVIGIYSILPVLLFFQSMPPENWRGEEPTVLRFLTIITVISTNIFCIWLLNIFLQERFTQASGWWGFHARNRQGKLLQYTLSYGLVYLFIFTFSALFKGERPFDIGWFSLYPLIGVFASNTLILILINLIITQTDKAALKLEKAALEISQLQVQQEQLKQQIHPHFLFNALGTLQILTRQDSEKAYLYANQLARFLRKSLILAQYDILPLTTEMAFLNDFIQLQKIRFGEIIDLQINIPDSVLHQGKLPVFTLQILAENAIKHNALSTERPLRFTIQYNTNGDLEVFNQKSPKFTTPDSAGIGLQNLRERFAHFTTQPIRIEDDKHTFKVVLHVLGL